MAEMFVEVQAVRSMLYCGLAHIEAAPDVRAPIVSGAKVVAADAGQFVGSQGVQLHGGIGVTDEYVVSHYYKALLAFQKIHADADWHLDRFVAFSAR
jgi:alkylation response protein AidB-like acyl-CoA dehydrogenase